MINQTNQLLDESQDKSSFFNSLKFFNWREMAIKNMF